MLRNKCLVTILLIIAIGGPLIALQLTGTLQKVYASESSPYDSGYDHGCDDAGRSESDKYINQPEKGPSFHTDEFMDGYYAGLNACADRGDNEGDEGSRGGDDGDRSGGTRSNDPIREFCAALSRGDYVTAEGLLASTGYGNLALGARLGCGLIELANSLEN